MGLKAVILCGGQGTRIREASEVLPKPMLPIGGKPIIWHIMKGLATYGVKEFVLCLGYKGWVIKEFFIQYRAMINDVTVRLGSHHEILFHGKQREEEWTVTLAETGEDTMTGGRVLAIRPYLEDEELFLLTYGDGVSDVNISSLLEFHRQQGKVLTVTAVRPPGRFGEMQLKGPRVVEFNEKPQTAEGLINGGFMVCDRSRIWGYLANGSRTVLEREPMQRLAKEGQLVAYVHQGFWQPMDTLREYSLLNELWSRDRAPWKIWETPDS